MAGPFGRSKNPELSCQRKRMVRATKRKELEMSQAASCWCQRAEWGTTTPLDRFLRGAFSGLCGKAITFAISNSGSLLEAGPHQFLDRGLGAESGLRFADGIVGFDLFETESEQRQHGIVSFLIFGRQTAGGTAGFPSPRSSDLVLEFDDDAFGSLFSNAWNL